MSVEEEEEQRRLTMVVGERRWRAADDGGCGGVRVERESGGTLFLNMYRLASALAAALRR